MCRVSIGLRQRSVKGSAHSLTRLSWAERSEPLDRASGSAGPKRNGILCRVVVVTRRTTGPRVRQKRGREGGTRELWIGWKPSSARNRPAGKRDTTGRLHYRAPTCFLSPRCVAFHPWPPPPCPPVHFSVVVTAILQWYIQICCSSDSSCSTVRSPIACILLPTTRPVAFAKRDSPRGYFKRRTGAIGWVEPRNPFTERIS